MIHGGNVWENGAPERWLDFSANLRPEGPPEWAIKCMRRAVDMMRYYPDLSMTKARRGLAEYAGVDEKRILPTAGGAAAIDLALAVGSGRVLIDRPTFGEYEARAAAHGRACADASGEMCRVGDTRVICNPNNPTGAVLSADEILRIKAEVNANGAKLLVDEAFIDYCPGNSVRSMADNGMMVAGSLTKILCVPGARLGYLCASPEIIDHLEKLALPWQLNATAVEIAAELPAHLDELRRYADINRGRRERMASALEGLGVKVCPSAANFLLCGFGRDMSGVAEELKRRGILVRTCASFGLGNDCLRLAVRSEEENLILIGELEKCLKQ